jgi:hypothetical protein
VFERHSMFELVPRGFRYYQTSSTGDSGVWLPVPIYCILSAWRQLKISYYRWRLRRHYPERKW